MSVSLKSWDKKHLRWVLGLFFLALAVPMGFLIQHAYSQLKWEAFYRHRLMAEELATRIDRRLGEFVRGEEARASADYGFLVVAGDPSANFLQRSPLSSFPVAGNIPGVLGYFQIDSKGVFTTPLLPAQEVQTTNYGISMQDRVQRQALQTRIRNILSQNRLVEVTKKEATASIEENEQRKAVSVKGAGSTPSLADKDEALRSPVAEHAIVAQSAFDRLAKTTKQSAKQKPAPSRNIGRVEDLKLDQRYRAEARDDAASDLRVRAYAEKKQSRKERSVLPEPAAQLPEVPREADQVPAKIQVSIFESEIDAFDFSLLDSGHFVMFRKVWRNDQRYIQGALIDAKAFIREVIDAMFRATNLSQMSNLAIAFQGDVLEAITARGPNDYLRSVDELRGELLYQTRLSAPLSDLQLIFSINKLPVGPGARVIFWAAGILLIVLCGGLFLMYSLGVGQINLNRQQQDFVSAVSHELKTPLTSIRMYGEMLQEGWMDETKKKSYYAFIHDESERLSRLINNVLQLARMTRNDLDVDMKPVKVQELLGLIRLKVATQCEQAGFTIKIDQQDFTGDAVIEVDSDVFVQLFINLVDNAIKFAAKAENKEIHITCRRQRPNEVVFSVRDYGPGIADNQIKKIFKLFYRSQNELTRETVGTGIGLALVHQLTQSMNAKIDVVNREPGAEFRLSFAVVNGVESA